MVATSAAMRNKKLLGWTMSPRSQSPDAELRLRRKKKELLSFSFPVAETEKRAKTTLRMHYYIPNQTIHIRTCRILYVVYSLYRVFQNYMHSTMLTERDLMMMGSTSSASRSISGGQGGSHSSITVHINHLIVTVLLFHVQVLRPVVAAVSLHNRLPCSPLTLSSDCPGPCATCPPPD